MLRLLHRNLRLCDSTPTHIRPLSISIPKTVAKSETPQNPKTSLAISYLRNSCGLSLSSALSAAKKLHLKPQHRPDAVLSLLKDHSFTKTQIAKLVAKRPYLLLSDPNKTIKPKLDFFLSVGHSGPKLAKLISRDPTLLLVSLDRKLRPNFSLLASVLRSDEAAVATLTKWPGFLQCNFEKVVRPNLKALQDLRVPFPNIVRLATKCPRALLHSPDRFEKILEVLVKLGLKRSSMMFIYATQAMCGLTELTWARKLGVYKSLGWSEEETFLAFTKDPSCMVASEEKIRKVMDFYTKKLRMDPSFLSARPKLLSLGFEKRIVPRCAVMNLLSAKGLFSKKIGIYKFLMVGEKDFIEKYVTKHREQVPEVVEAYQGTINFVGFEERKLSKIGIGLRKV